MLSSIIFLLGADELVCCCALCVGSLSSGMVNRNLPMFM